MNNPDHISESFETIFWFKILKFFDADAGSGIFLTRDPGWKRFEFGILDKHPGSATLILRLRLIRISVAWVLILASIPTKSVLVQNVHADLQKSWEKGEMSCLKCWAISLYCWRLRLKQGSGLDPGSTKIRDLDSQHKSVHFRPSISMLLAGPHRGLFLYERCNTYFHNFMWPLQHHI
jgi:hypothetical protein